jgi:hypothetical protein
MALSKYSQVLKEERRVVSHFFPSFWLSLSCFAAQRRWGNGEGGVGVVLGDDQVQGVEECVDPEWCSVCRMREHIAGMT